MGFFVWLYSAVDCDNIHGVCGDGMTGAWEYGVNAGKLSIDTDINQEPVFFNPNTEWAESLIEEMRREIRHYYAVERFKSKIGLG